MKQFNLFQNVNPTDVITLLEYVDLEVKYFVVCPWCYSTNEHIYGTVTKCTSCNHEFNDGDLQYEE